MKRTMRRVFSTLVVVALVAVASFGQSIYQIHTDKSRSEAVLAIEKAKLRWSDAWEKKSPEMIVELFAKDGRQMVNGRVVKGHDELFDFYQKAMSGLGDENIASEVPETWLNDEYVKYKKQVNISMLRIGSGSHGLSNTSTFGVWNKQDDGEWRLTLLTGFFKDGSSGGGGSYRMTKPEIR